ncbi:glycoside hydrolase family 3 N-terminal domain-containing protein [Loktanella sp. Alg231-35]|uniref:glycoside hydrolase family 3 N-terminal domain-containing protein n=1 Tax=Loktanella sp. Alg231-35 TaxID=1922220 RepID=UPI000D559535|nr:glycoside hydrolase family 3 N-terminal domain-containing protein [Loktanella sp. Alg231-35]
MTAAIFGSEGPEITAWEKGFFAETQPFGFILFARNIDNPNQLRRLTAALREAVGRDAPILIDQEGGRVQRMRSPHWREYLPALDQMAQASDPLRAQWIRNRLIAAELRDVGIDVNCAPLGDIADATTHPVLQNRLYGYDVDTVIAAARVCAEAHLAGGVLPVLKHIPGLGRGSLDSHLELPRVDASHATLAARDFATFKALNDLPLGMSAHIVFSQIDPSGPATTSATMMKLIREEIGFDGLLMTDDLSMEALSGTVGERAIAARKAGCDLILHCNGKAGEMVEVADAGGHMSAVAMQRGKRALAMRKPPENIDIPRLEAEFEALLG